MSIAIGGISSFVDTTQTTAAMNQADKLSNSAKGISSETTEEELLQVCKDFTSYFVEEVMKEVKENMTLEDEEKDSSIQTLTDFHMDSTIQVLADEVVDQVGESFTQQLYEQMKRNYNIE